jgi:hydrogenase expression/formation protein HypE
MSAPLLSGKLPPGLLAALLATVATDDPRVLVGPRPGVDAAVLEFGDRCLVVKSDPITFASEEIGWYAVQVNANDLAVMGAVPRWFLATPLYPTDLVDLHSSIDKSSLRGVSLGTFCW